ncbi:hypothetical protein PIB30_013493 [Stylosanthes scabra]|uniref:PB1 domain-containing protein n=1 Tax=Stylosanthes scabra TaxID=79078 RepID=A0ABU6Z319_9FABA|nr:hypothetical protein [Stylosanthes scabra]
MERDVRFLCSFDGEIKFHVQNNEHIYDGGHNKMVRVASNIKFKDMISVLLAVSGVADVAYFKYQIADYGLETLVSVTNDRDLRNLMREFDPSAPDEVKRIFLFAKENPSPSSLPPPPAQRVERVNSPVQVAENASEQVAAGGPRVRERVVHYSAWWWLRFIPLVLLFLVPLVINLHQQNHYDLKSIGTIPPTVGSDDQSSDDSHNKAAVIPVFSQN